MGIADMQPRRAPWWVWLLMAVVALPAFSMPWLAGAMAGLPPESRALLWLFSPVQLAYAWLMWLTWRRGRTLLFWILAAMGLLTPASVASLFLIA